MRWGLLRQSANKAVENVLGYTMTQAEHSVQICVYVNAEMKEELRRLYCRRNPLYQIAYSVLGILLLMMAVPAPLFSIAAHFWDRCFFVSIAAVMFIMAFGKLRIWWRWSYWPAIQSFFPEAKPVCCRISPEGLLWEGQEELFTFRRLAGLKRNEKVVLLFLTKSYALPFHRRLFQSEEDWQFFRASIQRNSRPLAYLLNTP